MWVWANSGSWWWTGRPGVLWFMGSQRVRHDWVTELNWTELMTHNRFPNLGNWQRGWDPPREFDFEGSEIWLQNLHKTGETDSWRAQTKSCAHKDPGERSNDPTGDWPRLACECPGVSGGDMGQQWSAAGWEALSVAVRGGNTVLPSNRKLD